MTASAVTYQLTATFSGLGSDPLDGERLMEGFSVTHPETDPLVDQDVEAGVLRLILTVEANDLDEALDRGRSSLDAGLRALEPPPVEGRLVGISVDRVPVDQSQLLIA